MSNQNHSPTLPAWRLLQRKNFANIKALADYLELSEEQRGRLVQNPRFPLQVPLRLAEKMEKGTLDDPLVKQFLPTVDELYLHDSFVQDPVADATFRRSEKLLHKYSGRALILASGACAMHCRYCFRQNFDYSREGGFQKELEQVAKDKSLSEIILSGGDPLSLSNEVLEGLLEQLNAIPHLQRIRFHTRFPIGIPERIDEELLKLLAGCRKCIYFVIHCNHPRELDECVLERLTAVRKAGCIVLNQAVLLKGVNNSVETLVELAERLVDNGILFYYLHQLDRVAGTAHFEVTESDGKVLIAEMAKQLPGYAVPKYVRETAGERNKTII